MQRIHEGLFAAAGDRRKVASASLRIRLGLRPGPRSRDILIPVVVATLRGSPLEVFRRLRLVADPRQGRVDVGDRARERHRRIGSAVAHRVGEFVAGVAVDEIECARIDRERHLDITSASIRIADRQQVAAIRRKGQRGIHGRGLVTRHGVCRREISGEHRTTLERLDAMLPPSASANTARPVVPKKPLTEEKFQHVVTPRVRLRRRLANRSESPRASRERLTPSVSVPTTLRREVSGGRGGGQVNVVGAAPYRARKPDWPECTRWNLVPTWDVCVA